MLRKVNTLTFRLAAPDEIVALTPPSLEFRGRILEDPRAAAIRKVRASHWGESTTERMGFVIGTDPHETSLALRQNEFVFILPDDTE